MLEILKLVVPLLCALVSGFVLAIFAEPARRWFWRPSLHLKFKNEKTPSFQWVYWPTLDALPLPWTFHKQPAPMDCTF